MENQTLKIFHFREICQGPQESFPTFCNRVEREAKHCYFKCNNNECTGEETAIRDQIIIGTSNRDIREEALLRAWDLKALRNEGMKMESAQRSRIEISRESTINTE